MAGVSPARSSSIVRSSPGSRSQRLHLPVADVRERKVVRGKGGRKCLKALERMFAEGGGKGGGSEGCR